MAQQVKIANVTYNDVPYIDCPDALGVMHSFLDTSIASNAAAASDIAHGKKAYVNGSLVTGTNAKFVHGEFTTQSTKGAQSVSIPYNGNGYPIAAIVVIKGGAYVSGTTWYNAVQQYAIGVWACVKSDMSLTPTYSADNVNNHATTLSIWKNSTSSATTYTRGSTMASYTYSTSNAQVSSALCVKFKGNAKTLSVYVNPGGYGLMQSQNYEYFIFYSN